VHNKETNKSTNILERNWSWKQIILQFFYFNFFKEKAIHFNIFSITIL